MLDSSNLNDYRDKQLENKRKFKAEPPIGFASRSFDDDKLTSISVN